MRVEKRVWPAEPTHPPAEKPRYAERKQPERGRLGRVRRERPDSGALKESAAWCAERLVSGTTIGIVAHEGMNDANNREARAGSVADRGPATFGVPAEHHVGEMQAAHGVGAGRNLHAAHWHLEYVCSACRVEHVRPIEEACECLAILAVADETQALGRRNAARDTAYMAAPAPKREVRRHPRHIITAAMESAPLLAWLL